MLKSTHQLIEELSESTRRTWLLGSFTMAGGDDGWGR